MPGLWKDERKESMKKIFIASPYALGDVCVNTKRQVDAAHELMNLGFAPFAPIAVTHLQHLMHYRDRQAWLEYDIAWLRACDGLLRLEGKSEGADAEVSYALSIGLPVFYDIKDIKGYFKWKEEE